MRSFVAIRLRGQPGPSPAGRRRFLAIFSAAIVVSSVGVYVRQPPAPEAAIDVPRGFFERVRASLKSDRLLVREYAYTEKRTELKVSLLGKVSASPLKVYEVSPAGPDDEPYRRLVSVGGVPLTKEELARQDREHQQERRERARRTARGQEDDDERRQREREVLDELLQIYDIRAERREQIEGRPTLVFRFTPREQYEPRSKYGKTVKRFQGRAWIGEFDYQLRRLEAEAVADVAYGLGLVGKLYKGSRGTFVRRPQADGAWLPSEAHFAARGRALFRKFDIDLVVEYEGYRRVATTNDPPLR